MYLEFEKKGLITKQDYDKVLKNNTISSETFQTNYYFETEDDYFKKNHSALRVRLTDEYCELTLKIRNDLSNIEYNHNIDDETFFHLINNFDIPKVILTYIDEDVELAKIISFETKRSVIEYKDHKIEVDLTDFGSNIDYEIEVEGENMKMATKIFNAFLKENKIEYRESKPKIARYFGFKK